MLFLRVYCCRLVVSFFFKITEKISWLMQQTQLGSSNLFLSHFLLRLFHKREYFGISENGKYGLFILSFFLKHSICTIWRLIAIFLRLLIENKLENKSLIQQSPNKKSDNFDRCCHHKCFCFEPGFYFYFYILSVGQH